ncbi:MAG: general secretion pathway protein GspC [Polyangiaceae bacterium]|nr:general secretion pathway protein GspC [Polyangiaceae bacterium]
MSFDSLLKRYFAVVVLALLATAAYFQASGITQVVGTALAVDDKALLHGGPLPQRAGATATQPDYHTTSAKRIIERNPFDSATGNLNPLPSASAWDSGPPLPATDDPYHAPECEASLKMVATAVSDDAAWSFALLTGGTGEHPGSALRRQGDSYGGKQVWFITWDRVWLIGPGAFCQVEMFPSAAARAAASAKGTASAAPSAAAAPAKGGAPPVPDDIKSKIQRVSATEFNVDRSVIDKVLENQAVLMRSARIVPEQENGKTVGIRLFGIRPDTLLGVIGMENGDRLEKINGFDMASPEKALEAYARLRSADHLTVTVNRRGQPTTLDFNIK